jgi:F0F1-type ATP synthase assembly protein I
MASENESGDETRRRALGEAFNWVGRVIAVAVEMVLPGVAGAWLDRTWGTVFLSPLGFVLGLLLGVTHLIVMVQAAGRAKKGARHNGKS